MFFYTFFPPKETLADAGDGAEGGGQKTHKNTPTNYLFYICFPWKGTLTDAGDGNGGTLKNKHFRKRYAFNTLYICIFYIIHKIYRFHTLYILKIYMYFNLSFII